MANFICNKKGGEKLLSIWWFFVLAAVGGGIVVGIFAIYGANVDTRAFEANLISDRIELCFSQDGYLPSGALAGNFDILSACGLSPVAFGADGQLYLRVALYDETNKKIREDLYAGNRAFENDCAISIAIKSPKYPVCILSNVSALYYENGVVKNARVEVLAASNYFGGIPKA